MPYATRRIIGDNIRCNRNKLHWTQEALGLKCGLHHDYIGRVERGLENISADKIAAIALVFNIEISTLFIKNYCFDHLSDIPQGN